MLKFGGTSVGTADNLRRLVRLVADRRKTAHVVIVVSALSGITDALVSALNQAERLESTIPAVLDLIDKRHTETAGAVLHAPGFRRYRRVLRATLRALEEALQDYQHTPTSRLRDCILATGERLSAPLIAALFSQDEIESCAVDGKDLIRTDDTFGNARVDLAHSCCRIRSWHAALPASALPVVTGFIGATDDGATTTLGRGGSDYSAALIAGALEADLLERWTDVDGLYTGDPRRDAAATPIRYMTFSEATERTRRGIFGLHPRVLDPLIAARVPAQIRGLHVPQSLGTRIIPDTAVARG